MLVNIKNQEKPWKLLDVFMAFLLFIISMVALRVFLGDLLQEIIQRLPADNLAINTLFLTSLIQTAIVLAIVHIFVRMKYKMNLQDFGFQTENIGHWIRKGLLNGVLLFIFITIVGIIISLVWPFEVKAQDVAEIMMGAQSNWDKILPLIATAFLAPVGEEVFFRGFIYPAFRKKIGIKPAILVTSLIFGCLHLDLMRAIPLTLGGIWLNILYEKSNSLIPSIIAHGTWNFIMTVLVFNSL